jgi:hypothetical protein
MAGDASLARLIKDYGDRWVIEHTGASTSWIAVRIDDDDIRIIGAHDIGGLRFKIGQAEQEDTDEQLESTNAGTG